VYPDNTVRFPMIYAIKSAVEGREVALKT